MQPGKKSTPNNGSDEKKAFHELSDHELLDIMATRTKQFLRAHGIHALFGLAVLLLIVVVIQVTLTKRQVADVKGYQVLSNQQPVALLTAVYARPTAEYEQSRLEMISQCKTIIEQHSASEAVPWARIRMAQLYALGQEWEKAAAQYQRVIDEQEDLTLVNAARAGLAAVREDLGEYEPAATLYGQVAERLPLYLMDAGRCYEMAGKPQEAAQTYARVETADVSPRLKDQAQERRRVIDRGGRYVYSPPPRVEVSIAQPPTPDPTDFLPETGLDAAPADTPTDTVDGADEGIPEDGAAE